jgi:membrane protease YdiL (CAAX protease family)
MQQIFRPLSPRFEFWAVILLAFGHSLLVSVLIATGRFPLYQVTNISLWMLAAYEIVVGGLLYAFLALRGWTPQRIGLRPGWKDTGFGLLLLTGQWICLGIILLAVFYAAPGLMQQLIAARVRLVAGPISPVTAVVLSCINAVFEEVFVTGYVITALRSTQRLWIAVLVSATIRASYHLYQGPMAVIGILPMGVLFGACYARFGRLWPLIVAHAVQDIGALLLSPHA